MATSTLQVNGYSYASQNIYFPWLSQAGQNNPSPNKPPDNSSIKYIQDKDGNSPTGTTLVKGQIGPINTENLRVVYMDVDVKKDQYGQLVPTKVTNYPGQKFEVDVEPNGTDSESWSERSTCYLSVGSDSLLLGAKHSGSHPKVITQGGDLWQKDSQVRILNEGDYKFFGIDGCDLSIFIENTDKGYKEAIDWLSQIVINSKIPYNAMNLYEKVDLGEYKTFTAVTNRLPGTRQETINGQLYDKVRNHSQNGTATMVTAQIITVSDEPGMIYGVVPRHGNPGQKNKESLYHGASGSPIAIGPDGMLGILSAGWSDLADQPNDEFVQMIKEGLLKEGIIKDTSRQSLRDFDEKYVVYFITPLTRKTASLLLAQVNQAYEDFRKGQNQLSNNLANS